jgi:hypothetical protein
MTAKTTAKRAPGRPVVSDADRLRVGAVRLTQAQWDKLAALGGAEWLRQKINAAKPPKD